MGESARCRLSTLRTIYALHTTFHPFLGIDEKKEAKEAAPKAKDTISPFPRSQQFDPLTLAKEEHDTLQTIGFEALKDGQCGVVILGGGMGTRLGSSKPKGCIDLGLLSKKSLYQMHIEKLIRVRAMVAEKHDLHV